MADTTAPPTLQELIDGFKGVAAAIPTSHAAQIDQYGAAIARVLAEQGVDLDDPEQARVMMVLARYTGNVVTNALLDSGDPAVAVGMCGTLMASLANTISVRHGRESVGEGSDG